MTSLTQTVLPTISYLRYTYARHPTNVKHFRRIGHIYGIQYEPLNVLFLIIPARNLSGYPILTQDLHNVLQILPFVIWCEVCKVDFKLPYFLLYRWFGLGCRVDRSKAYWPYLVWSFLTHFYFIEVDCSLNEDL